MQPPNTSEGSSQSTEIPPTSSSIQPHRRSSTQSTSSRQPRSNPHRHLLERTQENRPKNISDPKLNRWYKAANKAKRNLQLVQQLPTFHWPTANYDQPILIHHLTPHSVI